MTEQLSLWKNWIIWSQNLRNIQRTKNNTVISSEFYHWFIIQLQVSFFQSLMFENLSPSIILESQLRL